jgi:hypothetical protein
MYIIPGAEFISLFGGAHNVEEGWTRVLEEDGQLVRGQMVHCIVMKNHYKYDGEEKTSIKCVKI